MRCLRQQASADQCISNIFPHQSDVFTISASHLQMGETDWRSEHIGIISDSLVQGHRLLSLVNSNSTNSVGLVAALETNNGKILWRSIINKRILFKKMVTVEWMEGQVSKTALVTLSVERDFGNTRSSHWFLRAWTMDTGKLYWDKFLGLYDDKSSAPFDLVVETAKEEVARMAVLADNTLHFFSFSGYSIAQYWSWYPEQNDKGKDKTKDKFLLSQVLSASPSPRQHAAVGCFTTSASATCIKLGVVSVVPDAQTAEIVALPAKINAGDSVTPNSKFYRHVKDNTEYLVAAAENGFSLLVVQLDGPVAGVKTVQRLAPSAAVLSTAFGSADTSSVTASWGNDAVVTYCSPSGTCAAFALAADLSAVVSVGASAGACTLGVHSVAGHLYCMGADLVSLSESPALYKTLQSLTLGLLSSDSPKLVAAFPVAVPIADKVVAGGVKSNPLFAHVSLFAASASGSKLLLLTYHSGLTMLVKLFSKDSTTLKARVLWSRHEAISCAEQALIVEDSEAMGGAKHHRMPSFSERMIMQAANLEKKVTGILSTGAADSTKIATIVSEKEQTFGFNRLTGT
jgi:hypothetical protein